MTLASQRIVIKVYSDAKKYLLNKGYSEEFGARELRRVVETELLDRIAELLLKNPTRPLKLSVKQGNQKLIITL